MADDTVIFHILNHLVHVAPGHSYCHGPLVGSHHTAHTPSASVDIDINAHAFVPGHTAAGKPITGNTARVLSGNLDVTALCCTHGRIDDLTVVFRNKTADTGIPHNRAGHTAVLYDPQIDSNQASDIITGSISQASRPAVQDPAFV